jgi:hypothetical protein
MTLFVANPSTFEHAGDEYIAIIQFLLERGADPNVLRSRKDEEFSSVLDYQGTTCDQLAGPAAYGLCMLSPTQKSWFLGILNRIVEAGGHTSRPFPEDVAQGVRFFRDEVEQLLSFEDQIDGEVTSLFDLKRLLISPSS